MARWGGVGMFGGSKDDTIKGAGNQYDGCIDTMVKHHRGVTHTT